MIPEPMRLLCCALFLLFTLAPAMAQEELDLLLAKRIEYFRLKPFHGRDQNPSDEVKARIRLGRQFFMDARLAGNQNITCLTCHNPVLGTGDGLPLSQSVNGQGILRRNSPHLFNIGRPKNYNMFWDGRVSYKESRNVFITPEPALNGENPTAPHITKVFTSAAAAQAIFPLITADEMMGLSGENEIADAPNNLARWDLLVKRLLNPKNHDYQELIFYFQKAFPGLEIQDINIGHFGEVLAAFMIAEFESKGSPFHRYLRGEKDALTLKQKKGMEIFTGKGTCINCHSTNLLENNLFFTSVGIPSYGQIPHQSDRGHGEVVGEKKNFMFKTPSLINAGITAPYMHNGIFKTLREVVDHYNDLKVTIATFDVTPQMSTHFPVAIEANNNPTQQEELLFAVKANFIKQGLNLTEEEKKNLVEFLEDGLTDPKWK